ncbi:MAG: glycosyltransferase [Chloroflexi bacterium]|nr:MAG: glycosyltransferase [Chloroflexota bacterium]
MTPMISVIIPAYNAQQTIADCLRALQCQTVCSDQYEIIVVDDGSTDNTAQLAQVAGVQVIRQHNQGLGWLRPEASSCYSRMPIACLVMIGSPRWSRPFAAVGQMGSKARIARANAS